MHHKGLGLDKADRERIGAELTGGKAAVGVLAPISDARSVAAVLGDMGGTPETHPVSDETLEQAQAAAVGESS